MFLNEFDILICEVKSLKNFLPNSELYLNLKSLIFFKDIYQQRGLILIYLKKLPSVLLYFALFSIRAHQNLKKYQQTVFLLCISSFKGIKILFLKLQILKNMLTKKGIFYSQEIYTLAKNIFTRKFLYLLLLNLVIIQ